MKNLFAEKFISDFIETGWVPTTHYHALNVTLCSGFQGESGTAETVFASYIGVN